MRQHVHHVPWLLMVGLASNACGQVSSLGAQSRAKAVEVKTSRTPREAPPRPRNPIYEQYAWTSSRPIPPRKFKINDLLTIIVRENLQYIAKSKLKAEKDFELQSEIDAMFKFTRGGLGSTGFQRGKPEVDYSFTSELEGKGDAQRRDRLTTRLTAKIIDVKPNGLLVIEGRARVAHDDETRDISITGVVRKEDITANNTVLSTQIASLDIKVDNRGALRAVTTRGWIPKLLDFLKPF